MPNASTQPGTNDTSPAFKTANAKALVVIKRDCNVKGLRPAATYPSHVPSHPQVLRSTSQYRSKIISRMPVWAQDQKSGM